MGKDKRHKHDKKKDKGGGKSQKPKKADQKGKSGKKRTRDETGRGQDSQLPASPRSKVRKQVEITVQNNRDNTSGKEEEQRTVLMKETENPEESSGTTSQDNSNKSELPVEDGVGTRTRSKGELSEEDLTAQLPQGRKTKTKSIVKNADPTHTSSRSENENSNAISVTTGDGVQIQVNGEDEDASIKSSDDSESSSSDNESTSSESSDSSSDSGRRRSRHRSRSKRSRRNETTSSASSSEEMTSSSDEHHEKLLSANPGLKAYLEKRKLRQKQAKARRQRKRKKEHKSLKNKGRILKSPSGSTVYTHAVPKISKKIHSPSVSEMRRGGGVDNQDTISRGIERIRLQNFNDDDSHIGSASQRVSSSESETDSPDQEDHDRAINQAAEDMVVNSEKFKASAVVPPTGKDYDYNNDADFMMSTCHVDTSISEKASKGKYVELDKLVNKTMRDVSKEGDKYRLDLVSHVFTYFVLLFAWNATGFGHPSI